MTNRNGWKLAENGKGTIPRLEEIPDIEEPSRLIFQCHRPVGAAMQCDGR